MRIRQCATCGDSCPPNTFWCSRRCREADNGLDMPDDDRDVDLLLDMEAARADEYTERHAEGML